MIYKLRDLLGVDDLGGTMRLGRYACELAPGSLARKVYGTDLIHERHRHRFEFNCLYEPSLAEKGMRISGRSPDGKFVEIAELPGHPWFVAVQFHPEFQSRPLKPHPLFASFVEAAKHHKAGADGQAAVRVVEDATPEPCRHDARPTCSGDAGPRVGSFGTGHPLAFILGPCVIESEAHAVDTARRAGGHRRARRRAGRVQGVVRQGQPHVDRARIADPGLDEGLRVLGQGQGTHRPADSHRHPRGRRRPHPPRKWPTSCRFRRSFPGRPI